MDIQGKKVVLHDMCLRDGMHAKRHQISLDEMVSILCLPNYSNEVSERREEVIKKVKLLLQNELALKKQVNDLEKKETAYSNLIQVDYITSFFSIVSHHRLS